VKISAIVYSEIKRKKLYVAQLTALLANPGIDADIAHEIALYRDKIDLINSWLASLKEDERFVIEHHLIIGLDWDRIVDEHKRRWGDKGRSKRTLRYYQESAIKNISQIVEANWVCVSHIVMHGRGDA
jgi:hypothetical protein